MAMMERGEIGATIDASMGMVSFHTDLDRASSHSLLGRLEKQMQVCMSGSLYFVKIDVGVLKRREDWRRCAQTQIANELNEKLREVDETISCSSSYLSKVTLQDRQSRWGEPGGFDSTINVHATQIALNFFDSWLARSCRWSDGGRDAGRWGKAAGVLEMRTARGLRDLFLWAALPALQVARLLSSSKHFSGKLLLEKSCPISTCGSLCKHLQTVPCIVLLRGAQKRKCRNDR